MEVICTMPILFTIIKVLAILSGILLILLAIALLMHLGFSVEYRPDRLRVVAIYGPLRRTVWSHRLRRAAVHRRESSPPKADFSSLSSAFKAGEQGEAGEAAGVRPEKPEKKEPVVRLPEEKTIPDEEAGPPGQSVPEEEEWESGAVVGRLERMAELASEDPKTLGNCILQHLRWLQRHSIFKIHVRHLNIFWTATGEDAAETAILFGAEMAAFNTVLALVQQTIHLQSDCLWLEPDFTGMRRTERRISCTVSASAILMFHLLYRIWKDPLLQPTAEPTQNI